MTRYARQPERGRKKSRGWLAAGLSHAGAAVARNPVAVGGSTAFFVSLAFVSANALWYQPQGHPNAFLSTRAPSGIVREPEEAAAPALPTPAERSVPERTQQAAAPADAAGQATGSVPEDGGDPTVRAVQEVLSELGLYRGTIDGLTGPRTRDAVENYRRIIGLEPGAGIDGALLRQLGLAEEEVVAVAAVPAPKPAPRPAPPRGDDAGDDVQTASVGADPTVKRVQAGLKAFGNDGIEVDGIVGANTSQAISEFQSLFGLPVTGEVDGALVAKMQEIGLIN